MGLFLVILGVFTFFGPVTLEKADKLDGVRDTKFTLENYKEALKPIKSANHNRYNG